MKRIAISLVVVAFVALLATTATRSLFSSTASLSGITFSTGNASLEISQVCNNEWYSGTVALTTFNDVYAGCQFNFNKNPWSPGLSETNALYLGNFSTADIALNPTLQLTNVSQYPARLDSQLEMQIWWSGNATGTGMHPLTYYENKPVALPQIAHPTASPPSEANGGILGLNVVIEMNPNAGNAYQNGSIDFDFSFDATQAP